MLTGCGKGEWNGGVGCSTPIDDSSSEEDTSSF